MTEPEKMKVAELRAALQERGLDTKGTKPILVSRLQEAIREEQEKKEPTPEPEAQPEAMEEAAPDESKEEVAEAEEKVEETMEVEETTEEPVKTEETESAPETKKEDEKPPAATPQGVKRKMDEEPFEVKENEPEIPENLLCLDWHNSDLNLRILDTLSEGVPFSRDGWAYCYAAARATFGFNSGKIWYEVKYVDNMDVKIDKETTTYDLRVGWSTNKSSLMLGEDSYSWCYSSCEGKMANNKKFEDYGEKFQKGDVIGAFLDFTQGEINVTFTKNGEDQGDAFQISKEDLGQTALFPHIMTRNVKFEVNFGIDKAAADKENWMEPLSAEYVKVGKVEEGERERGNPRMSRRDECEMIMMIGLPGSGKTYWVDQYVADHPDKQYNVVSTTTMINKMTVNGEPRKAHHKGKWEQVVQKATRSLQEMIRAASQRRRNVIIDQTNVYPAAQKRKARPFEGFQRRAVVVLPTDEIYKERVAAQKAAKEMDIPDEAIMEMKANYGLPEEETDAVVPMFKQITFTELDREEAVKVIELYNKVAKEKGYGKKHEDRKLKKFKTGNQRPGNFKGNQNQRGGRNNNRPMRGMRGARGGPGGPRGHPMRGGPWMRGRGGPMGPGPMPRGGMMNRGGPMGPSPWQGNNMGGPMRNNMGGGGGGGGAPGNWGPWNAGGGMGPMGNMNNMGPRQGMGGGGGMFSGNQSSNYGNNQGFGNNGGPGNGGFSDSGFSGNMGGGGGGGYGNPGGQRRNFDSMGGGMNNYGNNQGGHYGNNPTGTWSTNSNMMRGQSPANNYQNNFGNNFDNNFGNKFSGQQGGGMRQNQGQKFGGGGNFRGNMNRGMGMSRGGANRGNRGGRRF